MATSQRQFGRSELARLGRQVRLLRERSSLTRAQLAAKARLSASAVRDIELGRSSPNLATVVAISSALGITLDDLVGAARRTVAIVHTKADAAADEPRTDLSRDLPEQRMRAQVIRLASQRAFPPPGEELGQPSFCFVLDGSASVRLGGEAIVRLSAGDGFHAAAGVVHAVTSFVSQPARLLWVTSTGRSGTKHQL